ncbi:hypothetical protein COU78_05305 [Candidatus Peregrinibacteria bacterium CG10_big_fil_rev_8_21_14_0_10_49_24]|nr:MAG: hypothetical protein COV83_01675 [Candidatus Peregrinibacteria bacterium CG11_big_fil_rev_8_21_14_0_20_49_14]PIR50762.1 MAG: hypothetical protein COU78_05305 [Candidatus Peregrinibacteria bacterium CG10_big_fil_rev_8_21_14_0_10_49_24]PJA68193.1 MAG: hypothetical protein CO157_00505 [Candidatus Peregrinibacteria bacterium CG_4_9_14_3_um_filter_49_12]
MKLLDTTLRDGNQVIRPGMSFQPDDQIDQFREYALAASDFGMHFVEAGIPIAGPRSRLIVGAIAQDHRERAQTSVLGFSRAKKSEIDLVAQTVQPAARRGIALLTSVSDFQMDKFGSVAGQQIEGKRSRMLEVFRESVRHAKSQDIHDLLVYLEDSTRADIGYLLDLCAAFIEEGATIISVPDTVGHVNDPEAYLDLLQELQEGTPGSDKVDWSVHLHNDRGIAVATALLAAKRKLMNVVEGTINGEGERSGNMPLSTYILNTHIDGMARYEDHARMEGLTDEGLTKLDDLSGLGSLALRIPRSPYMPGHGQFSHKTAAGMHQDGILKNPFMFASYDPKRIGVDIDTPFVYSDQSGRKGLKAILEAQGVSLSDAQLEHANADAYQMAVLLGGRVTDSLLHATAWEAKRNGDPLHLRIEDFDEVEIRYEKPTEKGAPKQKARKIVHVTVPMTVGDDTFVLEGKGDGPTSAFVAGLSRILEAEYGVSVDVEEWVERAVTHEDEAAKASDSEGAPGRDATVWGFARMRIGADALDGYGYDTDATYASLKSCLQAVNHWCTVQRKSSGVPTSV